MNLKKSLLILDDEPLFCETLAKTLAPLLVGVEISTAYNQAALESYLSVKSPDCVVMDLCLDPRQGVESGYRTLLFLAKVVPTVRVIVLTSNGADEFGIRCIELGATNFVEKPVSAQHIAALVLDAMRQKELRERLNKRNSSNADWLNNELIGNCSAIINLRQQILFAALSNKPVLFWGELGVGKKLCAKILNRLQGFLDSDLKILNLKNFTNLDLLNDKNQFLKSNIFFINLQTSKSSVLKSISRILKEGYEEKLINTRKMFSYTILNNQNFNKDNIYEKPQVPLKELSLNGFMFSGFEIRVPTLLERVDDLSLIISSLLQNISSETAGVYFEASNEFIEKIKEFNLLENVRSLELILRKAVDLARVQHVEVLKVKHLNFHSKGI